MKLEQSSGELIKGFVSAILLNNFIFSYGAMF